jgi:hypothetical protein
METQQQHYDCSNRNNLNKLCQGLRITKPFGTHFKQVHEYSCFEIITWLDEDFNVINQLLKIRSQRIKIPSITLKQLIAELKLLDEELGKLT